ncbi:MAG TPA: hypothetical protein VFM96_05785 [Gaiellaceae bacterium]|nr:hypothetical protein [Gaiellaceae bacterium]
MTGTTVSFDFVAGTVATVNPCVFALLPAYLARRVGVEDGTRGSADAVSRALLVGGVTTAGFMLVFGTIGTAIGLGAHAPTSPASTRDCNAPSADHDEGDESG